MRGAPSSYGAPRAFFVRRAFFWGAAAIGLATAATACFTRIGDPSSPTPEGRPCESDRDCPQPNDPCRVWTCWQQVCTGVAAAKDTLLPRESQVAGDCRVLVCDGQGQSLGIPDKTDQPPEDDNPCAEEICEDGAPAYPPVEVGTACGKSGVCNGKGKCGVCLPEDQRCKGNKPETCSEEGEWTSDGPCPLTAPICSGVACISVTEIGLGSGFTCGVLQDGTVRCFGGPENGKLGQNGAQPVHGLSGVEQISAGAMHTCALLSDRTVQCWGSNIAGQLGDDTPDARGYPAKVSGLSKVKQIAAGQLFSCALLEGGTVSCWGSNEFGQLGLGTTAKLKNTPSPVPQRTGVQDRPSEVKGLGGAAHVALGRDHACALLHDGTVSCWGSDDNQALGRGRKVVKPTPMMVIHPQPPPKAEKALPTVKGLKDVQEIVVGSDHACALLSDQTMTCWGHNHRGQLGDGTTKDAKVPVKVKGLAGVLGIAVGGDHSCALVGSRPFCWGAGQLGELGDPAKKDHAEPFEVPEVGELGIGVLRSGENHVCAWFGGADTCWGDNSHGELGSGSTGEIPQLIVW